MPFTRFKGEGLAVAALNIATDGTLTAAFWADGTMTIEIGAVRECGGVDAACQQLGDFCKTVNGFGLVFGACVAGRH